MEVIEWVNKQWMLCEEWAQHAEIYVGREMTKTIEKTFGY